MGQPLITGFTFNEPAAFAPYDADMTGPPDAGSYTPLNFGCGALGEATYATRDTYM